MEARDSAATGSSRMRQTPQTPKDDFPDRLYPTQTAELFSKLQDY
jgi:hypothetical protein